MKLQVHPKEFSGDEILINPKEFPDVIVRDILEIYHPEDEYSRLLLQVQSLTDDFQQKDTVSIEKSIAATFQLRAYMAVCVNKVNPKNVSLDLVELLFKDQYYSRSDMWRMRNRLIDTCVYLGKKIEYVEMRTQVNELCSKGEKVTCGVISSDTRIVFRSSTAVVQIFIQMSSEMWEFDINGDLYFEKAVNGFLTDLFAKWKEQNCCHDVTIVLFSRTFYDLQCIDDFPSDMRDCLQQDYKGRYYEDFYRIVVQNERYDDWMPTMIQLRKLFNEYLSRVLDDHRFEGCKIPQAHNSSAAQGNFLETLNMSLNLFEKYYLDRNFDRTGKVSVVITPGAGVFEVDRELTNITKQRTIDCGVGSDLVCMGEQPLHAAPLFRFHSKNVKGLEVGDDYNIPHWMNHSFYTSKSYVGSRSISSFIPRIKPPPELVLMYSASSYESDDDNFPFIDYDEYDAQVFKMPAPNFPKVGSVSFYGPRSVKKKAMSFSESKQSHGSRARHISDDFPSLSSEKGESKGSSGSSPAISIPSLSACTGDEICNSVGCYPILEKSLSRESADSSESEDYLPHRPVIGSAGSPASLSHYPQAHRPNRALINPFAPSWMQFKMTSNRRRWVHAFPTDPKGTAVQPHHIHAYNNYPDDSDMDSNMSAPPREVIQAAHMAVEARKQVFARQVSSEGSDVPSTEANGDCVEGQARSVSPTQSLQAMSSSVTGTSVNSASVSSSMDVSKKRRRHFLKEGQKSWMWGPTGEQEWSPDMTTGQDWRPLDHHEASSSESRLIKPILTADIHSQNFCAGISVDWKSLTIPASLPITTDYFPDKRSLQNDYVESSYDLLPDDVNTDYYINPPATDEESYYRRKPLTANQVYKELVSQRLGQGFQLITRPTHKRKQSQSSLSSSPHFPLGGGLMRARPRNGVTVEHCLSIGRIFHKLKLEDHKITVKRYRPKHPHAQMSYNYLYRFHAPDSISYDVSCSHFHNEILENYNWNYLDQYICTRGDGDYGLMESLKFWRSRFFLLPCSNTATKKIIDGSSRCDLYEERTADELNILIHEFVRYVETLNKIRRTAQTRRPKGALYAFKHSNFCYESQKLMEKSIAFFVNSKPDGEKLKANSSPAKILEAMTDQQKGVYLFTQQSGLPSNCFIASEAVEWCQECVSDAETVPQASAIMQRLIDCQLICHASGNFKHKFIYGFYLYLVVPPREKSKSDPETTPYNFLFQNEWCEVTCIPIEDPDLPQPSNGDTPKKAPAFSLLPSSIEDWRTEMGMTVGGQTWGQQSATLCHKYVSVDVDVNGKSDRCEWATARYHAYYEPRCAFELQIQWMVTTGCLLGELISSWSRKAVSCGFHLLPVPGDPFALPSAADSDPLRGPIYVPLNIKSVAEQIGSSLFSDFCEAAKNKEMTLFQEAILRRYGFLSTSVRIPHSTLFGYNQIEEQQQFVHCTGGMFVLIEDNQASSPTSDEHSHVLRSGKKSSSELRKDYIARQTSNICQDEQKTENKIGFLWSWNYLLSKRWRSANTGDEHSQDRMLEDFRQFNSDKDGRLTEFWKEYTSDLQNVL
ncbi:hypothetical protein ScPMuIL_007199 [Solemya velum]